MNTSELLILPLSPYPNNEEIPLRLYKKVFASDEISAESFERLFLENQWGSSWRNGVYSYHHFHSKAHEVLGCYSGSAQIIMGGPNGEMVQFNAGDAVCIPAGVSHCLISSSSDFHVVGAYPQGSYPDLLKVDEYHFEEMRSRIRNLARPVNDPVSGQVY